MNTQPSNGRNNKFPINHNTTGKPSSNYNRYKLESINRDFYYNIVRDTNKSQKKFIRRCIKYYQNNPKYLMSKNKIRYIINKVKNQIEKSYRLVVDEDNVKFITYTSMTKSEITKYILENLNL